MAKTLIASMLAAVLLTCGVGAARAVSSTDATRSTETTTDGSLTTTPATTDRPSTPPMSAKKVCPPANVTSPMRKGSARPWIADTNHGPWVCFFRAGTKLTLRFGARSAARNFDFDVEVSLPPFCRYQPKAPPGTFLCWSARIVAFTQNIPGHGPGASSQFTWIAKRGTYNACATGFNWTGTHAQREPITVCKTLIVR